MSQRACSVLFLGKTTDHHTEAALEFCRRRFTDVTAGLGAWGDPLPPDAASWSGEYIFSYLSRWVVPDHLLRGTRIAAINFHPGSPEYPGIGSTNFALYERATEYGVTCHRMAARVDTGAIIAVRRFPILPTDTVATLLARTYDHQLQLFHDIATLVAEGRPLPVSGERWARKPFRRYDLDQLARITPDMTEDEVTRRIRATAFGRWKPVVDIHGFTFELKTAPGRDGG